MVAVGVERFRLVVARFRLGVQRLGVTVGLSSDALLIYFHLSSLPISSRGILYSVKALASCFQPAGAAIIARFRRRSLTRSTRLVLATTCVSRTNSNPSFHHPTRMLWRRFSRRVA